MEFALSMLVLMPLTVGTITIGLGLTRYLQAGSVCRSAASMFVRGVDFTREANQRLLGKVADGLGLTAPDGQILPHGRGVVILSVLMRIGDGECMMGGYAAGDARCANRGRTVVIRRIVVGNRNLRASSFASPGPTPAGDGVFPATQYLIDSSFAANRFGTASFAGQVIPGAPLHLGAGEVTYLAESYFTAPELNLFPRLVAINGLAHRNFF